MLEEASKTQFNLRLKDNNNKEPIDYALEYETKVMANKL